MFPIASQTPNRSVSLYTAYLPLNIDTKLPKQHRHLYKPSHNESSLLHYSQCHKLQFNSVPPCNFAFPIALQICCITWSSFLHNCRRLQLHWFLGEPFLAAQSRPLLAACLLASPWTLAIVQAITCDFASQSRCNIVPTLDDLTLVISVTLLCPLGRTPHALTSAQHACCAVRCSMDAIVSCSIAGGHGKSAPHSSLLWWDDRILAFPTPQRSYTHSSRLLQSLFNEGKKYARFCPSGFPLAGALAASKRRVFLLHHGAGKPQRSHTPSARCLLSRFNIDPQRKNVVHINEAKTAPDLFSLPRYILCTEHHASSSSS